mgnify:CR=1 FL=1
MRVTAKAKGRSWFNRQPRPFFFGGSTLSTEEAFSHWTQRTFFGRELHEGARMKDISRKRRPSIPADSPGERRYRWQDKRIAKDCNLELRRAALVAELAGIPSRTND